MLTRNELYQNALRTVAARRQSARARAEEVRLEAEAAIPALKFAEEEVRVRGVRCALAAATGKDRTEAHAALAAAKTKLETLLKESGRSPDCLNPRFVCRLCSDTGAVEGKTCQCVRLLMQQQRREELEAMSSLKVASFDTLNLDYYPNVREPSSGRNIRLYMAELLDDLKAYAEDFGLDSENLMLYGNSGLGKTHAALAIAGSVLQQGRDVIYLSCPDFFARMEGLRNEFDPDGQQALLMDAACRADLLILDDLGTEYLNAYTVSTLYNLLNNRLGAHRPTIITTNIVDGVLLEKRYTEKVSSRISAFVPFRFLGEDIRLLKASE